MSLLMDALKRAETTKQEATRAQFGGPPAVTVDALSLEPLGNEMPNGTASPLPDLATYQDAVDADLASTPLAEKRPAPPQPKATPAPAPAQTEAGDRQAVRNAFSAKQPPPTKSRQTLWLAAGALAFAVIGIGGYVWYELNAMNRGSLAMNPNAPAPALPAPALTPPPPAPTVSIAPQAFAPNEPAAATPLFAARREPIAERPATSGNERSTNDPIRLIRTRPELDANLARGHTNLQRGEAELARQDFEQVLQRDPNSTDALLALAAIAHRQGRPVDAENLRQRALIANPSDPAAQAAALNGTAAETNPQATESRLKTLLSSQPESAGLNFALGNLYARQNRWPEAQQVYFNAVAADGDNPDYLFNLAVSLDHLRQGRLAAQHYRLALEAASRRPGAFDRNKVEKRLGELQSESAR